MEGKKRGIFSFYLQKALRADESETENDVQGLFSKENQQIIRLKSKDAFRKMLSIFTPLELQEWFTRTILTNENQFNLILDCGPLLGSSKLIGIPYLGRSKSDYKIELSYSQFESAKNIAILEKEEVQLEKEFQLQQKIEEISKNMNNKNSVIKSKFDQLSKNVSLQVSSSL